MAASPSSVLTLGYGDWGSVNLVPTLGYGAAEEAVANAGLEAEIPFSRLHAIIPTSRLHATSDGRLHTRVKDDP